MRVTVNLSLRDEQHIRERLSERFQMTLTDMQNLIGKKVKRKKIHLRTYKVEVSPKISGHTGVLYVYRKSNEILPIVLNLSYMDTTRDGVVGLRGKIKTILPPCSKPEEIVFHEERGIKEKGTPRDLQVQIEKVFWT